MRILITGAASGIGYDLGVELVKRNHTVYFTTHTESELVTLKAKLLENNIDALSFKMDITTKDIKLVDKLKIDCLINNAAIGIGGSPLYMNLNGLKENYKVNVFSTINLIKRVYNNMLKDKLNGKIIVISSLSYYIPIKFISCYTSSKAALSTLSRTLNKELRYLNSDINISLVELCAYRTGFNEVMIDNKSKYIDKNNKIYNRINSINKKQKIFFELIEKKNHKHIVKKIIRNIEKKKSKFLIKDSIILTLLIKIYLLFN